MKRSEYYLLCDYIAIAASLMPLCMHALGRRPADGEHRKGPENTCVYKVIIRLVVLYGCEIWTMSQADEQAPDSYTHIELKS